MVLSRPGRKDFPRGGCPRAASDVLRGGLVLLVVVDESDVAVFQVVCEVCRGHHWVQTSVFLLCRRPLVLLVSRVAFGALCFGVLSVLEPPAVCTSRCLSLLNVGSWPHVVAVAAHAARPGRIRAFAHHAQAGSVVRLSWEVIPRCPAAFVAVSGARRWYAVTAYVRLPDAVRCRRVCLLCVAACFQPHRYREAAQDLLIARYVHRHRVLSPSEELV